MDTRLYHTNLAVHLKPVRFNRAPTGRIGINGELEDIVLTHDTWFNFSHNGEKDSTLTLQIEHYGKTVHDSNMHKNQDTAIIVDQIIINGISSPNFVWQGIYYPEYPDYYTEQHLAKNIVLDTKLSHHTYMGWNGKWQLDIGIPAFTWIHKIENLGWIYD